MCGQGLKHVSVTCWTKLLKFHTGVSSSSWSCCCSGCSSEKLSGFITNTCPCPDAVYGGYKGASYPITTFCMKKEEGKQNITQAVLAKNNPFLLVCLLKKQNKQNLSPPYCIFSKDQFSVEQTGLTWPTPHPALLAWMSLQIASSFQDCPVHKNTLK